MVDSKFEIDYGQQTSNFSQLFVLLASHCLDKFYLLFLMYGNPMKKMTTFSMKTNKQNKLSHNSGYMDVITWFKKGNTVQIKRMLFKIETKNSVLTIHSFIVLATCKLVFFSSNARIATSAIHPYVHTVLPPLLDRAYGI